MTNISISLSNISVTVSACSTQSSFGNPYTITCPSGSTGGAAIGSTAYYCEASSCSSFSSIKNLIFAVTVGTISLSAKILVPFEVEIAYYGSNTKTYYTTVAGKQVPYWVSLSCNFNDVVSASGIDYKKDKIETNLTLTFSNLLFYFDYNIGSTLDEFINNLSCITSKNQGVQKIGSCYSGYTSNEQKPTPGQFEKFVNNIPKKTRDEIKSWIERFLVVTGLILPAILMYIVSELLSEVITTIILQSWGTINVNNVLNDYSDVQVFLQELFQNAENAFTNLGICISKLNDPNADTYCQEAANAIQNYCSNPTNNCYNPNFGYDYK
jgi:hypothetical protein